MEKAMVGPNTEQSVLVSDEYPMPSRRFSGAKMSTMWVESDVTAML